MALSREVIYLRDATGQLTNTGIIDIVSIGTLMVANCRIAGGNIVSFVEVVLYAYMVAISGISVIPDAKIVSIFHYVGNNVYFLESVSIVSINGVVVVMIEPYLDSERVLDAINVPVVAVVCEVNDDFGTKVVGVLMRVVRGFRVARAV